MEGSESREVVAEEGGAGRHAGAHDRDVDFNHAEQHPLSFLLQIQEQDGRLTLA